MSLDYLAVVVDSKLSWNGTEEFLAYVDGGELSRQLVGYNDRFILRFPDSKAGAGFKMAVSVFEGKDDIPYAVTFQNSDGADNANPFELMSEGSDGKPEYTWVKDFVTHLSFGGSSFTVRDNKNTPLVKIAIWDIHTLEKILALEKQLPAWVRK